MAPQAAASPATGGAATNGNTAQNTPAANTPAANTPAANTPAANTPAANTANTPAANSPAANTAAANTAGAATGAAAGQSTAGASSGAASPAQVSPGSATGAAQPNAGTASSVGAATPGASTPPADTAGSSVDMTASGVVDAIASSSPTTSLGPAPNYATIAPQAPPKSNTLSGGAIGGIVGGIVGGLAFLVLVFFLWKMCRGRGEKMPPPPPRPEMHSAHRPTFGHHGHHSRNSSMGARRASSYSTLLANRPPSTYMPQQYYSSYPATSTPSSFSPDNSPRFGAGGYPSGSPSLASSGTGANTPAAGVVLAPRDSSVRDGASSSDSASGTTGEDRELRPQGSHSQLSAASGDIPRPVTPSERSAPQGFGSDSRTVSPRASTIHLPSVRSSSNLVPAGHVRHPSLGHRAPSGGAPHTRNALVLTMPRPLSQHSLAQMADPAPPQLVYTPRTSLYSHSSHRNSYQSARSYSEFGGPLPPPAPGSGTSSAPRSPTSAYHHPRPSGSGSFGAETPGPFVESPVDVNQSPFNSSPLALGSGSSKRHGHGIV